METAIKTKAGTWRCRAYINGRRRSFTASTKRGAESLAYKASIEQITPTSLSFGDAITQYVESKSNVLSPTTITGYYAIIKNYIKPELAQKRLDDIRLYDLQRNINVVSADVAPKTVSNVKGLITATMRMFRPDMTVNLKVPAKIKKDPLIPSDDDVRRILHQVRGTDLELPIMLAAFGSLRRSEICGLLPDSVYDDRISVRRAMIRTPSGTWVIKDTPKTYAGYRDVQLPADVMSLLHAASDRCTGPVVNLNPTTLYKKYKRTLAMLDLPSYKFHALRHYFASACHKMGVPDQYIMRIGGWSDLGTLTKIYQHTMEDEMELTAAKISAYYNNIKRDDLD